jgi:uncharacterized protein (DUF1330 family)
MNPKLSEEQREALLQQPGKPLTVEDDQTRLQYVIIPFETFQRVQALFDEDEFQIKETYASQFAAMNTQDCWDAPGMDDYDD